MIINTILYNVNSDNPYICSYLFLENKNIMYDLNTFYNTNDDQFK